MFSRLDYYYITIKSDEFVKFVKERKDEIWRGYAEKNLVSPDLLLEDGSVDIISKNAEKDRPAPKNLEEMMVRLSEILLCDIEDLNPFIHLIKEVSWEEGCYRSEALYNRDNYDPEVLQEMYDFILEFEDDGSGEVSDEQFEELIQDNNDEFTISTKFEYNQGNSTYTVHDPFKHFYFF